MLSENTKQAMQELGILWDKVKPMCEEFRRILKRGIKSRSDEEYVKQAVSLLVIQYQISEQIAGDLGLNNPCLSERDKLLCLRFLIKEEKDINILSDLMGLFKAVGGVSNGKK